MKKILLLFAIFLLTISSGLLKAQTVTPAASLQLCPDNIFVDLDSIIIIEDLDTDFAVESGVTYSLILPTGFKFEPFTGNVFLSDSFTSGTFTVFPDSLQITYSLNAGSAGGIDSIIISGLRVRTSTPSLVAADIDRAGTATHAGNAPGANSHGSLSSGQTLNGITVTGTPVDCNGDNNGELTVAVTSGNAPYDFSIDFGMTYPFSASPITLLSSGGYVVTVRDNLGCVANSSNVGIIANPPIISGSVSKVDISCNGLTNGQLTATATGGTGIITYSINGSGTFANGSTRTNLTQGAKSVVFTDANGCTSSATNVTINEPTAINIAAPTTSDPTTAGGINGQIVFGTVSGGTPPYNFSINAGTVYQSNGTFNNLGAGIYTLQVRDNNNCIEVFGPVTLNDPGNISPGGISFSLNKFDTTLCNGAGSILIRSDSAETGVGVSYQWQISINGVSWSNLSGATAVTYTIPGPQTIRQFFRRRTTKGGDVAFSNSVEKKIDNGNTISITIPDPTICVEDGIQTFSASPAPSASTSGIFSLLSGTGLTDNGNGSSNFNPLVSGANTFTVDYTFTNEFGCVSSNTANITVNQNTSVNFIDQTSYLTTDPAFTLTGGSPPGGNYGGPGVFGNQFFPGLTGAGNFNLTYTQVDGNGCSDTDLLPVTVSGVGSGDITGEKPAYCSDEPTDTITGIPASGGTASGFVAIPGLLSPLGSNQAIINPNFAPGNYIIQFDYQLGASVLNVTTSIRINTAPTASINTNGSTIFCLNDPVRVLNGIPSSGAIQDFTGAGISNDVGSSADFTPLNAGVGNALISYIYEDANGCNDTASVSLTVNPTPSPSFSGFPVGNYCSNDLIDTLIGSPIPNGTTTFGFYSGPGLSNDNLGVVNFAPGIPTLGNNIITYTYTNSFGCTNSFSDSRSVSLVPTATLSGLDVDYCINSPNDVLTGGTNPVVAGTGVYQGLGGAAGSVNPSTGEVNVSGLTPGNTYQYAYIFQNPTGCVDTAFQTTTINALPIVSLSIDTSFCIDGPVYAFQGLPVKTGNDQFTYEGPGLTTSGNQGRFTPANAGVGVHELKYIFTEDHTANNCTDSASQLITVNSLPVVDFDFIDPATGSTILDLRFCKNQDSIVLRANQTTNLYFFLGNSGAFTQKTSNGEGYFNPNASSSSPLNKSIRYEFTSDTTGCFNSITKNFQINPLPAGFNFDGLSTNDRFCTQDNQITLSGSSTPQNFNGFGTYRLSPTAGVNPGGIFPILPFNSDEADFDPRLNPGGSYDIWYRFTDTTTGCQDSLFKTIFINVEPVPNISITSSGFGTISFNPSNSGPYDVCTNEGFLEFRGFDGIGQVPYNNVNFSDPLQGGNVKRIQSGLDSVFAFDPKNTNTLGIRNILFQMTSSLGCTDSFSFQLNLLDTPSLNILFDPTFLSSTGLVPEVCKNVDTVLVNTTASMQGFGTLNLPFSTINLPYSTISDSISNPVNDTSLYVFPNQIVSQLPVSGRNFEINYLFTETLSGRSCTNEISRNIKVNPLPRNFDYFSIPGGRFDPNRNVVNQFCTVEDSVLLVGAFTPSGNPGSGYFNLLPDTTSVTGGIFNVNTDTAIFKSSLVGGSTYKVWYIFTDSVTGCTDSIDRTVEIFAEPELSVRLTINNQNFFNSNSDNPSRSVCINNGSFVELRGINTVNGIPTLVAFGEQEFDDLVDPISIQTRISGADTFYVFNPLATDSVGLHDLQFNFTSNAGCKDKFTFQVNVLDTPKLNIFIDTTYTFNFGQGIELCKSVDTLLINRSSDMIGYGTFDVTPSTGSPIIPALESGDSIANQPNDTLLTLYPNQIGSSLNFSGNLYTISYELTETMSGSGCSNEVNRQIRINPLPSDNFLFDQIYCEYDDIDTLINQGLSPNLDTGYYKGNGIVNFANFSASLDPSGIVPAFTDQGTTQTVWYIFTNDKSCTDSISKDFTVHPKPDIEFTIQDTVNSFTQFCESDPSTFIIQERQPNGTLNGQTSRFFNSLNLSGPFFTPLLLNAGPNTLYVRLVTNAGCVDIDSQEIFVYEDPIAGFFVENFCIVDSISFRDTSLNNTTVGNLPDSIVEWEWQLTPFDVSNDRNPKFDYDRPNYGQGNYVIELRVTNSVGCSDDTDNIYFFGEPPIANFSSNDICAGQDILFRNLSDNVDPTFVNPSDFKWTFTEFPFDASNPIFNLSDNADFVYNFSNPGAYAVRLDISASYGCSDTIIKRLDIRPVIDLSNDSIYTSNFDNDSIEWRPFTIDQNSNLNSWAQTVPTGNRINSAPANGDQNFWVTNMNNGKYFLQEKSYLEGPCFDFSEVKRPMIRFDYFSDVPANTGAVLQYSLDRGNSWRNIGVENSGIEWYNERSIAGNPGNQALGQVGWSISNSGWLEARHELDTLRNRPPLGSNNPFVRLRFAFGSDNIPNTQNREGFAFGNIQISERDKLVLVEHFTNSSDQNANQGDLDHNNLLDTRRNRFDVLDIQYHTDFPNADPINLDNPLEQGARTLFYGVSSIPRTVFEGNQFNGATATWVSNTNILDNGKQRLIAERILEDAKFDIDLNVTKTSNSLSGNVTFTAKQNLIQGREYTGYIAVIEKFVPRNDPQGGVVNQGVEFRNIFKKFLPQAAGTNIKQINNIGDSRSINFNWNYSNVYNPDSVYIVAFIQDNVTREIYQVATDDQSNIWVPNSLNNYVNKNAIDFNLYPNPNSGRAILQFGAIPEDYTQLSIYSQMGTLIVEEEILPGSKNILINLEDYAAGVYIIQVAHPKYGVKKSRMVITK